MSVDLSERVLVLAPTGRDGPLIVRSLEHGRLAARSCADVRELCDLMPAGVGAVVLAEEAMTPEALNCLGEALATQPAWSDVPLILLTGGGKTTRYSERVVRVLESRGNVTLLERPLRMLTLVSAAGAAIRARRRQYQVRSLLEESQRAIRQRDQFLAMLGHELRNPLAAIRTAIEVLNHVARDDGELAEEQAQVIARQSANMARLVDDLLDVARVTSGKILLDRRPLDLRDLAASSLRAVQLTYEAQQRRIAFEPGDRPLIVNADPVRIEQVVTNLLTNAVRYTPRGGNIRLKVFREGGDAVLGVLDDGDGISPALLPRIFEPFVQSEQQLARSKGGLGIGLTVVKALVAMHDGAIIATSPGPQLGSEFVVRLPLAPQQAPAPQADGGSRPRSGSARRVLLVEDNADARRTMHRLLKLWGHQVETAENGSAGVEKAVVGRPEVALVDIGLPDVDGYEVARRTRAILGNSVRLIALTGYGQPEDCQRALDAGFDRHLVKPVNLEQLQALLADDARL